MAESMILLAAVLAFVLITITYANDINGLEASRTSTPSFPFSNCARDPAAYSFGPTIKSQGAGQYCFQLSVQSCTGKCCVVNLRKVEFHVNSNCDVTGARLKAAINGVPTKVPSIDKAPAGPVGSALLRVTSLGLDLSSDGVEICLSLGPNNAGRGCTTLEQLCVPPAGMPPGVCRVSMFNSVLDCCPVSTTGMPSPPPSPPPPPPQPATPAPCESCISLTLDPPDLDNMFYRFDEAVCKQIQEQMSADLNAHIASRGLVPMLKSFYVAPSQWSSARVSNCGTFSSWESAQAVESWTQLQAQQWLQGFLQSQCRAGMESYSFTLATDADDCLYVRTSGACSSASPFPSLNCSRGTGLPLDVSRLAFTRPGRNSRSTAYCFVLGPDFARPQGSCSETLRELNFWANDRYRWNVTAIRLDPAGGPSLWISPVWGPRGDNLLRASLYWDMGQAIGGQVCIEVHKGIPLDDFCLGPSPNTCFVSVVDTTSCCPIFSSGLAVTA